MTSLELLSHSLLQADQDFSTAFMIVNRIQDLLKEDRRAPVDSVLRVCERVLQAPAYRNQKQAYFLYRSVSDTLQQVMMCALPNKRGLTRQALDLLLSGLASPHESIRRAACEGLGMLPLAVDRDLPSEPETKSPLPGALPVIDQHWLAKRNIQIRDGWSWAGRSLRTETRSGAILVVKCLRKGEDPAALQREAAWMLCLTGCPHQLKRRFQVPQPMEHGGGWLVCTPRSLVRGEAAAHLHPKRYALAFLAPSDYFDYPNEASPNRRLGAAAICEVLGRNAYLMGRLTAMGIAHTAPIPLFHNRAQRHRREDEGRYRWTHRGRLDRWLASCRHPNFGASGLRDFEHFATVAGRRRYEVIGSHLISLLLVAGSYFREKAPGRVGFDAAGQPVDARDLFDRDLLKTIVGDIWHGYVEGFTGQTPADGAPVALDRLIDRDDRRDGRGPSHGRDSKGGRPGGHEPSHVPVVSPVPGFFIEGSPADTQGKRRYPADDRSPPRRIRPADLTAGTHRFRRGRGGALRGPAVSPGKRAGNQVRSSSPGHSRYA